MIEAVIIAVWWGGGLVVLLLVNTRPGSPFHVSLREWWPLWLLMALAWLPICLICTRRYYHARTTHKETTHHARARL